MYFLKAMGLGVWGSREEDGLSRLNLLNNDALWAV